MVDCTIDKSGYLLTLYTAVTGNEQF